MDFTAILEVLILFFFILFAPYDNYLNIAARRLALWFKREDTNEKLKKNG